MESVEGARSQGSGAEHVHASCRATCRRSEEIKERLKYSRGASEMSALPTLRVEPSGHSLAVETHGFYHTHIPILI